VSLLDEYTRECLAIRVAGSIRTPHVLAALTAAMAQRGKPEFLRSDNGSQFTATAVMAWLKHEAIVAPASFRPAASGRTAMWRAFTAIFEMSA
jgi:putative transposase